MKRFLILAFSLAVLMAAGMTNIERYRLRTVADRPRCEARQPVVIGGVTNIVETWRRGPYTWVQTNAVKRIVGKFQKNTFAERIAEAREAAEQWRANWQSATNRAAIAEARAARFAAFRAWLVEQRDKSPLQKKIYQAIIDRLDGEDE